MAFRHTLRAFCAVSLLSGLYAAPAQANYKQRVKCQQSLSDGCILTIDEFIPSDARFTILRYAPVDSDGGWTHGTCVISVSKAGYRG